MTSRGKCPEDSHVFDKGEVRVMARAATEEAAFAAMRALLPQAKIEAEKNATDAYRAALVVGNAGCKPGTPPCEQCNAIYWRPAMREWQGAGSHSEELFRAKGGYYWTVLVACECPEEVNKRDIKYIEQSQAPIQDKV